MIRSRMPVFLRFAAVAVLASSALSLPAGAQPSQEKKPAAAKTTGNASAKDKPAAGKVAPAGAPGGGQANLLASFGDWGAYASQQGKSKICYALTQPKAREPKNLNRDPAFFFVSSRPGEGVRNEVSLVLGFAARDNVDATAVVGSSSFALVTKATNAWVKNPAEESQVIGALAKGDKMLVKAESKRGNKLSDEYSLKGFSQALERVKKECP